ncbi:MAG: hypothetical protein J1E62_02900 [Lachnospiraceae bacterium]|nr:hypothetical protein [Lachnospiraceae bacterium]
MKKTMMKTLLCSTIIISLAGCGVQSTVGDNTERGKSKTETAVKKISITESETAKVLSSLYPHDCTDNYFYTADGMNIVQCNLEGEELQRFEMPGVAGKNKDEEIESLYVTEKEILYTVYCDDDKSGDYGFYEQLCSVPVQRENTEEKLLVDQTEEVMREDSSLWVLYADKDIIAYSPGMEGMPEYCEYDRVNKKQIPISRGDEDVYYVFPIGKSGTFGGDSYDTVILARYEKNDDDEDEEDHSVYAHKVGSQEIEKIATHYIDKYSGGMDMAFTEGKAYYTSIHDSYTDLDDNTDKYNYDIRCYDSDTGENSVLVSEKELKKIEPEFTYIGRLFVDGNSIYAFGSTKKARFVIQISQDADGKVEVEQEKELNQALNAFEDAYIEDISGGKCYYVLDIEEQDDGHYVEKRCVFDLSAKESKEVTESDPEYYCWKYEDEEE